jgi:hypothetical protein
LNPDETLVAIEWLDDGRFRVIELPARSKQVQFSRRRFARIGQAETYMTEQYFDRALVVQPEDVYDECRRRCRPVSVPASWHEER